MLPGIRFIFVTVILSASVLIFGLGAAALLRVSHEEFATPSSWRVAQPQFPPTPVETNTPTLAMLRVETPEVAKEDLAGESPNPTPAPSSDANLNTPDALNKLSVTAEAPPQPEAPEGSTDKSLEVGGQPAPVPADSPAPAPSAIAVAPTPAIEKQASGPTEGAACDPRNSEAEPPEAQADQTATAGAKPHKAEPADIKVADAKAPEIETSESKVLQTSKTSEAETPEHSVTVVKTAAVKGQDVTPRTAKIHAATPSKPAAKKPTRSGLYAVARRRAAARARAIARARAAQLAQQRLAATDPLAALFGIPTQPAQVMQTTPHQ
ncbi:hypothetical protein V1291_001658 [Nitrobacteraceae bacterium AZCC 1564]